MPLLFLILGTYRYLGSVQIKCINLEGDTEIISETKGKGFVSVEQPLLAKKFGEQNVNLVTKF